MGVIANRKSLAILLNKDTVSLMKREDDPILAALELDERHSEFVIQEAGELGSACHYIRHLIKMARWKSTQNGIAELVYAGLKSGPAAEASEGYWAKIVPGFTTKRLAGMLGKGWPIFYRPIVAKDIISLLAEFAPRGGEAASDYLDILIKEIAGICRDPARAYEMPHIVKGLHMKPVGRSVARVAYIVSAKEGIDVVRILHRDRHRVLERDINSALLH